VNIPSDLSYTAEHEWVHLSGDTATVGVTEFAAESLGDVVYLQLPNVGERVTAGQVCGEIESTKSVSELYAPATGEVIDVNTAVDDRPELVNSDPFADGWLFRLKVEGTPELLDAAAYAELIQEDA
jgi:glycine cleavage system H protein